MPHINQRKYHSVKRLHHTYRHGEHMVVNNFPSGLIADNFFEKTSKYINYFDYPFAQLLTDHSTDTLQNTTRQYIDTSVNFPTEGRFVYHEMIIRRNGETTILRPKQDLVLANGFTPVIRPSSILPSYQSIVSHSQVSSSLSIMNKMSMKKSEQTSIIKTKRKDRHGRKRYNEQNEFQHNNSQESNFIYLAKQALHEIIEQKKHLPPPLMSILPEFHNPYNQSFIPQLFNQSPFFNEQGLTRYKESFYDLPSAQYRSFEQNFNPSPQQEHVCLHRNYTHMPGYFLN